MSKEYCLKSKSDFALCEILENKIVKMALYPKNAGKVDVFNVISCLLL